MWRGAPSRVRPAAYGEPWFDPNQQMLVWPLLDVTGEVLGAELPWSELHAHAIARIEALGTVAHGAALVLRTRLTSHGVTGEPISLVLPDRPVNAVDALHFAEAETNAGSRWVAAMRDAAPRPPAPDQGLHRPAFSPLVELRGVLETLAERGTSGVDALATATTLARHHQALRGVGLLCFPELDPTTEDDPADLLIRSHYLLQQVELALP